MRYSQIRNLDIANGPGCRVSLFVSGCEHRCKGCFNPETWNFDHGREFTEDTLNSILKLAEPDYISGLSILGGEPAHPRNLPEVLGLARKFKEKYPDKTIWLWTGYLWEEVASDLVDSGIDVVVDGKFVEELKDFRLKYRGSSNQRVILVEASLKNNNITLYE
jgi:anaerobic ribonucleoside-triphosphate reductase activating protein